MVASVQGEGNGDTHRSYSVPDGSIPLLHSFYFNFRGSFPVWPTNLPREREVRLDNHINKIEVMPGGSSVDTTPNHGVAHWEVPEGRIDLSFKDSDPGNWTDEYDYHVAHSSIHSRFARRYQVRGFGARTVSHNLPDFAKHPFMPLHLGLAGFQVYYLDNRDREVRDFGIVLTDRNVLEVTLGDEEHDIDDTFHYTVDLVAFSTLGLTVAEDEAHGDGREPQRIIAPQVRRSQFLLRGFRYGYDSEDHHLGECGVFRQGDFIDLYFGDKGHDDAFEWHVYWSQFAPQVFRS